MWDTLRIFSSCVVYSCKYTIARGGMVGTEVPAAGGKARGEVPLFTLFMWFLFCALNGKPRVGGVITPDHSVQKRLPPPSYFTQSAQQPRLPSTPPRLFPPPLLPCSTFSFFFFFFSQFLFEFRFTSSPSFAVRLPVAYVPLPAADCPFPPTGGSPASTPPWRGGSRR